MANDHATLLQLADDRRIGVEDVGAGPIGHLGGVAAVFVHRAHRRDPGCVGNDLVVLAEAWRQVDDAGAVLDRHEVGGEHLERVRRLGEVVEQRRVPATDELGAFHRRHRCRLAELGAVGTQQRLGEDVASAVEVDDDVVDVSADGERQVGRQRPRRGRPCEQSFAGLEFEPDGQCGVLPVAIDVVHSGLGVGQRGLTTPAVGDHAESLVDQPLVPQGLEGPHDALHVREVESLVVVVEVDPAGLSRDVVTPVVRELQDTGTTGVVELVDAERRDVGVARDAELLLGFDLGRKPVAVPAEPSLDTAAAHRLVPRNRVFDVARQEVAVVRQTVRKRRPVVEHELVRAVLAGGALVDRGLEGVVLRPPSEDVFFESGKARPGVDVWVGHATMLPTRPERRTRGCGGAEDQARSSSNENRKSSSSRSVRSVSTTGIACVGSSARSPHGLFDDWRVVRGRLALGDAGHDDQLGIRRLVELDIVGRVSALGRRTHRRTQTATAVESHRGRPALVR